MPTYVDVVYLLITVNTDIVARVLIWYKSIYLFMTRWAFDGFTLRADIPYSCYKCVITFDTSWFHQPTMFFVAAVWTSCVMIYAAFYGTSALTYSSSSIMSSLSVRPKPVPPLVDRAKNLFMSVLNSTI